MQPLMILLVSIFGHGDCVNHSRGPGLEINSRCRSNADLRCDLTATMIIRRDLIGADQGYLPQQCKGVRVECIQASVLGCNIQYVTDALVRDSYASHVEGLRIHFAVDAKNSQQTECRWANIR